MAEAPTTPDEAEVRSRWGEFAWTDVNGREAMDLISRGRMLVNTTAILGAMDIVFGECDR